MKNVHLIPTDKPSKLYYWEGKLRLGNLTTAPKNLGISNQHIYITSDEEIKEGDWFVHTSYGSTSIQKALEVSDHILDNQGMISNKENNSKIISTTDQDLTKDGVQAIDDEFLEWFVKNPSCEEVEVVDARYDISTLTNDVKKYPNLDVPDYKIIIQKKEPKQQKLEEAKIKHIKFCIENNIENPSFSFDKGAKWQQDNSNINALNFEIDALKKQIELLKYQEQDKNKFSKDDIIKAFYTDSRVWKNSCKDYEYVDFNKWFEQFKNK